MEWPLAIPANPMIYPETVHPFHLDAIETGAWSFYVQRFLRGEAWACYLLQWGES